MSETAIRLEKIGGGLAREVKARSGASPMSCLQCAKCTSGCPVASRADVKPHELVRLVQMDQRRAALASRSIWECTSCQTCAARCPQKVDVAAMKDALRAMSVAAGMASPETAVPVFDEAFLRNVRTRGRVHEMGLMAGYKLRTLAAVARRFPVTGGPQEWMKALRGGARQLLADADKAPLMMARGKLSLFGPRVRGKAQRRAMFRRATGGDS